MKGTMASNLKIDNKTKQFDQKQLCQGNIQMENEIYK